MNYKILLLVLAPQIIGAQKLEKNSVDKYTGMALQQIESINALTYAYWDMDSPGLPVSGSLGDDNFGQILTAGDFNNDGYQDLAIGNPAHNFLATGAGSVIVLYGTQNGLNSINSQILAQEGSSDSAEFEDKFGSSLTAGDFNGDGYSDLVVGTPLEDVNVDGGGVNVDAGAINIFYGSASGLPSSSIFITAIDACSLQAGCQFGFSLAAGDIDDDGYTDLAVSAPFKDLVVGAIQVDAGVVFIYNGQATVGITSGNRIEISQDDTLDTIEAGDLFGWSLVFDYFDDASPLKNQSKGLFPAYADLIVGVPNEDVSGIVDAGIIQVFNGEVGGLTFSSSWSQASFGDLVEAGDLFGFSLASGDFNGDLNSDLIVGVPFEDIVTIVDAGAVNIIYGSGSGLTSVGSQVISQNTPGVFGVSETEDYFGFAVATGRLNSDSLQDVVVSAPLEDFNFTDEGFVHTIFGSNSGLDPSTSEYILIAGLENEAHLGNSLATMSFQGDTAVIIGAPTTTSGDGDLNSGSIYEVAYKDHDLVFRDDFE